MPIFTVLYHCSRVHRICIVIAFTIYVAAGRAIFHKRKQLRTFQGYSSAVEEAVLQAPCESHPTNKVHISREVTVSGEVISPPYLASRNSSSPVIKPFNSYEQYSVFVGRGLVRLSMEQRQPQPRIPASPHHTAALAANAAAWGYTKCAILFFVSLTITWVCAAFPFLFLPLSAPKSNLPLLPRHPLPSTAPTLSPPPKFAGPSPSRPA